MNVGGIGVGARADEMSDERRVAVRIDSLPPFKIAAFPDKSVIVLTLHESESVEICT